MFRRKDEDITHDLLSEATQQELPTQPTNTAENTMTMTETTPSETSGATTPAAQPSGYTRPASSNASRPSSFRPGGADFNRGRNSLSPSESRSTANSDDKSSSPKTPGRRVLTVGNDILLKGEIATCDRLVIEGAVDATLNEVHTVEIAQEGSFKGNAEIEDAEISGLFEGELVVRNRLVIYSTGKVRGKITYGEIEIERGGEMSGEIKCFSNAESNAAKKPTDKKAA